MKRTIDLKLKNKDILFENLYLTVLALYLLKVFFDTTLFSIPWPQYYDSILRVAILMVVLLREGYRTEVRGILWIFCISVGVIFALSWLHTRYAFLLDIPLLMLGAFDIPYKRILKVYIGCGLLVLAAAVVGSCTGCIEDLIYFDFYEKIRFKHSFGIVYSTDFSAHVVYLLFAVWVVYDQLPLSLYMIITAALTGLVYFYSGAKCSTIVLLLFLVGMLYEKLLLFLKNKCGRITFFLDHLFLAVLPCCAAVMVSLMFLFNPENAVMQKVNVLLTGRLQLANDALEQYGLSMWGTAFDMIGNGGNTVRHQGYNFVDSSYCMVLIRYGLMVFLVMCVLYEMCAWRAGKNRQRRLLVVLSLVAVHNAVEHHILELAYNIFLILPFARLHGEEQVEVRRRSLAGGIRRTAVWAGRIAAWACGAVLGTGLAFWAVAYGKTLVTLLRLYEPGRHRYFILAVSGLVTVVFLFAKEAVGVVTGTLKKSECRKRNLVILLGVPLLLLGVWGTSNGIIHISMPIYEESIQKGADVISILKAGMEDPGKIYVDDLPVMYRKNGTGVSWNILSGEGLVTKENTVLLTAKDKELRRLMENGFWFGELSEQEGIYTNDQEAVQILKDAGINMEDFYGVKREVDMALMADANGLARTDTGGVLVEGEGRSLIHGPWLTLYRGRYRVVYHLKLKGTSIGDGSFATVRLSTDSGKVIIQTKELSKADFDENGECVCVMEADIWDVEGAEFLLFAQGDTTIGVESIEYEKIGKID